MNGFPRFNIGIVGLILVFVCSCSAENAGGNRSNNPTSPGLQALTLDNDPSSDSAGGARQASRYLWGFYWIACDTEKHKFEVIPSRQVSGHWNAVKWLEQGPCINCVTIPHVETLPNGTKLFDVKIKHPFGINYLNFTGFDVRGIAMFNGSHLFPESALTISDSKLGDGELLNPDGHTTLYGPGTEGMGPNGLQGYIKGKFATPVAPDSMLNGYRRHVTDNPENTRGAFYAGDEITEQYNIDMPDTAFVFGYAVDACWAPPLVKPVVNPITDFPPEANSSEPWSIYLFETPVGQGLTDMGGELKLEIMVFDYQGKDSHQVPLIECPELFDGVIASTLTGFTSDWAKFEATVSNSKLAPVGEYKYLVAVEDNDNATAPEWLNLTSYKIDKLTVTEFQNDLPVSSAIADPNPPSVCEPVAFQDDGSYDPDGGLICKYEWDWENDGIFDEEGATVQHTWDAPGIYQVQFRVTDDEASTDILDSPLEITIENVLPSAEATADPPDPKIFESVSFDGTGSYDNDCGGTEIVQWEWDWENDGVYEETAPVGIALHTYTQPGLYEVQMRVTDDEGGTDTLDSPLLVTVSDKGWAVTFGSAAGIVQAYDVATDSQGNVYVVGHSCEGTDFDPGTGEVPSETGMFLASYDPVGSLRWAHSWPSGINGILKSVAASGTDEVAVTGFFTGPLDFDPGPGVDMHPMIGASDIALMKFDSDGLYIYGKSIGTTMGGGGTGSGEGIVFDASGIIYVCGYYRGTIDFDPDSSGSDPHTSIGKDDNLLVSFQANGDFRWAKTWGGADGGAYSDKSYDVCADQDGNTYTCGMFASSVDFNPGSGWYFMLALGEADGFITSFDTNGAFRWARSVGGDSSTPEYIYGVAADPSGYVYACGGYAGTVDFDPGANVDNRTSQGSADAYLVTYTTSGTYDSVLTWGGTGYDTTFGNNFRSDGTILVTGDFGLTVDFDPGASTYELTSNGDYDAYLSALGMTVTFQWARSWGGLDADRSNACSSDLFNNSFVCGNFKDTVDFDPGPDIDNHTAPGPDDAAFIIRFLPNGNW